jgi:hypothetical protein
MKNNQLSPHFLLVFLSVISLSACSSQKDRVSGLWHLTATCPKNGVTFMYDGKTEFSKDGSFHEIGRFRGVLDASRKNTDAVFSYESMGNWSVGDNKIVEKILDFKVKLEYFTKNGGITQGADINPEIREGISNQLGSSVKKGLSHEILISDLSDKKMSLKYKNSEDALAAGSCENQEYNKENYFQN